MTVGKNSSRREFLRAVGVAAAASPWAAPVAARASDKSGTRTPRVGKGAHTYEVHHHWGELPQHVRWGNTHGVTIDEDGLIYVKHRTLTDEPMDSIVVFDEEGRCVRSFGKEFHNGGHGIDIRREDGVEYLYLSDIHNRRVVKTDLMGEHVWEMSYPEESGVYRGRSQFRPTNVAFAPDGGFYVADGYGSHFVHQYDADARWTRTWGGQGQQPGQLQTPHGLWLDNRPGREPSLVVADRANARLQYFTLDGEHAGFVQGLSFPADIDIQGDVLLCPDLHARVTLFDGENRVIDHLGYDADWTKRVLADKLAMRNKPELWQPGRFVHPHDACFDRDGSIFVVEWVPTGRVSKLVPVA